VTSDHLPPGQLLDPSDLEKRYFHRSVDGAPRVHLHVRAQGRYNTRYALLCRDYLRVSPSAREAYAVIKRQLARYFPDNIEAYYDIKDPVFDVLMAGAFVWAEVTGWNVPAFDV
jgi:GrpB-like predicted nucleotidyltransferase (UPF0157 family)